MWKRLMPAVVVFLCISVSVQAYDRITGKPFATRSEIIALPVVDGSAGYLAWLTDQARG